MRSVVATSEVGIANIEQKMSNDLQRVGKSQHLESTQAPSSTVSVSSGSRPSSNYNNRSQVIGPQKGTHICDVILEVDIFCDIVYSVITKRYAYL